MAHDPPFDYLERRYENIGDDNFTLNMREHAHSMGSRQAGEQVRNLLLNLLAGMPAHARLRIDFAGVSIVSSSFADEVFGRVLRQLGPMEFMSRIELVNVDPTVRGLLDRAMTQRFLQAPLEP